MAEFLIESYVSRTDLAAGVPSASDVEEVADQLTREGRPVALLRVTVVPEEETSFYLFRAKSSDLAREAAERAGVVVERVVKTLPEWAASTDHEPENSPQPEQHRIPQPQQGEHP